jgi:N-glycosylase/DNA lyase
MCQGLCKAYSSPLLHLPPPEVEANTIAPGAASELEPYYPFPPPSALAVPDVAPTLRNLKFGYRADFIGRTASMLVEKHGSERAPGEALEPGEKWLLGLRAVDTETARAELLQFVGVGRKVADCVLLMSMDKGTPHV